MTQLKIMVIAGEASGDLLASELVAALKAELAAHSQPAFRDPRFFGAGGPRLSEAGVELAFDLTQHAVVGLIEVLRNYGKFRALFRQLLQLAVDRKPDVIICVDFSGFNRRFAAAVRRHEGRHPELNWRPRIVQYVSPQVWASRPKRANQMARDFDLLLSIFPFEKEWYARHAPELRVEFVGHPVLERHAAASTSGSTGKQLTSNEPLVVLLPGSRTDELKRHLPILVQAAAMIASTQKVRWLLVAPNEVLAKQAREQLAVARGPAIEIQTGKLSEALQQATIALASTGTVTMECACFGVPTVAMYRTSWSTYEIGKRLITVKYLAMPNLLANELIFPEFVQDAATPDAIAQAALDLLNDADRRQEVKSKLARVMQSLGGPGASARAARAVVDLLAATESL